MFTRAEIEKHVKDSGKKYRNSEYHSLPTGLQKAKAFLADEYLHEIQTLFYSRYFYYKAKCFHSFKVHDAPHNLKLALCIVTGDVKYAYCGSSCAAGKLGFCNHILALMMKVCKYSLYDCKDVCDLKDEEDEIPTRACTSALQNWHKSRTEGIRSQPVMDRPVPIVLVKCWKVAHWNAKKLLKNCQKSKKLLPKFQKLLPKFLAIFI